MNPRGAARRDFPLGARRAAVPSDDLRRPGRRDPSPRPNANTLHERAAQGFKSIRAATESARMATPDRNGAPLRASLLLVLALSLVALAYRGVLAGDFVWDDHPLIDEQPATQTLRPLVEYFAQPFWSDPAKPDSQGFYRPLVNLSYALEWQLWGGRPAGFHATNLAAHLAACALLFALALRAGAGAGAAFLATLLFGLHPRLTESVAWISGRTDVLASGFVLAALWLHRPGPDAGPRRWAAGLCLLLGLLCKEVALAGVLAIAALEWRRRREAPAPWRETAAHVAPALLALAAWGLLRGLALAGAERALPPPPFPLWQRLTLFPLEGVGRYLAMLLDPLRPRLLIGVLGLPDRLYVVLGALATVPLLALGWRAARRASPALFSWLVLGAVPLLLVLNVMPLPASVVAADRFLYLPLAALAIALASASASLPPAWRGGAALAAGISVVLFGITTARHTRVWADDVALWRFGVAHASPRSALPHAQLGHALAWHGRPEEAITAYREALRIEREHPLANRSPRITAQANLALALSEVGEFDEARRLLEEVVEARPDFAVHHLQLAAVHARALRFDDAAASLERARALVPDQPLAAKLLERLTETRRRWEALPAETPGEAVEVVAERAAVMALAGRIRDADALWIRVLERPDAPPRLVQQAAVHLAYGGYRPDAARLSFVRLRELGADPVRVARLETVLAERRLIE